MKFPTYEEMAQNVAEKVLDEYEYKGRTIRQWIEIISASELGTNLAEVGTDCISRQQAIDVATSVTMEWDGMYVQDLNVRIREAIEQLPPANNSEIPNSSDTISRQMLLEYIHGEPVGRLLCDKYNLDGLIEQFPPAEPKMGKWIYCEDSTADCVDGYRCDQCGFFVPWDYKHKGIDFIQDYNLCPNCGAKMEVNHESN